jgi:hypothetical protein
MAAVAAAIPRVRRAAGASAIDDLVEGAAASVAGLAIDAPVEARAPERRRPSATAVAPTAAGPVDPEVPRVAARVPAATGRVVLAVRNGVLTPTAGAAVVASAPTATTASVVS